MKRFSVVIFILVLAAVFSLPAFVSAATNPGVKPGSFFYFFDTAFEKIGLFFIANPEKKARKALEYANERLAEVEAIAEEKDSNAVKTAIANYENNVALAAEKSKEVKDKGQVESLFSSIKDNASKNQEILSAVLIKVPEEAREAVMKAIEASKKGQEEAIKQIAELKSEVEKLKQEVAELKTKDEERKKTIEELSNQKEKITPTSTPIKSSTPKTSATPTSKPATAPPKTLINTKIQTPTTPVAPVKTLKINTDKSEIWASGFHYANFGFEYLIDDQPIKTNVSLKSTIPSESIFAGWQALISTDKKFSYSTKVPGKHTLKFITDTGTESEITIVAKEWPNKQNIEIIPIQIKNVIETGKTDIISTALLGSFKIKTNPDIDIRLYDCFISSKKDELLEDNRFKSYKIEINNSLDNKNNNCYNFLLTKTDNNGFSEEFKIYLNEPNTGGWFYLNNIVVQEVATGKFYQATSSPRFTLEINRY